MIAQVDITGVRLETERLILRTWQQSDLDDLYEYARVEGVGEMAGWMHHKDKAESQKILNMFLHEKKTFALELKENGRVIGSLGLEGREFPEGFVDQNLLGRELGYVLSKDYWGRGLMTEAVRAVIGYCFQTLNYDFVTCAHFKHNDRSRRVIEKSGFQYLTDIKYETQLDTIEESRFFILYNER